jgi:hypothetical protein
MRLATAPNTARIRSALALPNLRRLHWPVALLATSILLFAVYSPTLLSVYDYHDSFYRYHDGPRPCRAHPQWLFMLIIGRPIYNFASCFLTEGLIATPSDGYKLRIVGIGMLCVGAASFATMMRRQGVSLPFATLLAASLFALPGYQVMVNMTSDVANLLVVPLLIIAFALLDGIPTGQCAAMFSRLVITSLVLLLAMLIYQQLLPIFFIPLAIFALLSDNADRIRRILAYGTIAFGIGGVLYLALHTFVLLPYAESLKGQSLYTDNGLRSTFDEMAVKFLPVTALKNVVVNSPRAFSLWFINLSNVVWMIVLTITIGVALHFIMEKRKPHGPGASRAERGLWLLALFVLVNVLVLMSAEPNRRSAISFHTRRLSSA